MKFLTAILLLFFFWGVAINAQTLTVNGATKESYERSVKAMIDELPESEREAFARGLINLIITRYPPAAGAEGLAALQFMEPAVEAAHITLDGVSQVEILEKGREIMASDASNRADEVDQTTKLDAKDSIRACLQERVLLKNVTIEPASYGRDITIQVTNNLPWAIAGIIVEYVAMSDGRSVPWHKDRFSMSISGGVEPGESRELTTSASLFPSSAPEELITTATVFDVSDPLERQLVGEVTVIGWSDDLSPMVCE